MKKLPYNKLYKKVKILFHKLVKLEDSDWRGYCSCYTCETTKPWNEMECGHYKHGKLDFDKRNNHVQCTRCNHFLSGNLSVYAIKLETEYGAGILQELERDSSKYEKPKRDWLESKLLEIKEKLKKYE